MDFEFTEDQYELRENARSVLSGACPPSLVRAVYEGDASGVDGLWKTLLDLGWPAIGVDEARGGLGLSFVEVGLVVEELARVVAPSPFVATVTQFVPMTRDGADASWPQEVASGAMTGAVALTGDVTAERRGAHWFLNGNATHVLDAATSDQIAVVAGGSVFVVSRQATKVTPLAMIDPTMPMATVRLDQVEVNDHCVLFEPGSPEGARAIERAVDEATTAMALSVVGTCRVIFDTTLEYAKVREQFGRPIGSFQALKHRFANMLLALEKASSLAYFAALTVAEDDERRTVASSMAKAAASDCQRLLVTDGLQLHGGIGFTWENDLHFWLKRAKAADFMLGTGAQHRARLVTLMGLVS